MSKEISKKSKNLEEFVVVAVVVICLGLVIVELLKNIYKM